MWGQEVALRVRDRKIREMAKVIGYTNAERRYKLLGELGRDLEICNCAISGTSVCSIYSVPVSDPGYRSSLTEEELCDEMDLDSARVSAPQMRELARSLFQEAAKQASEDRSAPYKEAVESLKEEVCECRERIERLSLEADYRRSELEASEEERRSLAETVERQAAEISSLRSRISEMTDEAGICRARMEELSAQIDELKSGAAEAVEEGRGVLERIREMKASKIDYFMDRMLSGEMDMDVCDDLISVLKTDMAILDRLAADQGLDDIPFVARLSPEELAEYERSLSEEEKALEEEFRRMAASGRKRLPGFCSLAFRTQA